MDYFCKWLDILNEDYGITSPIKKRIFKLTEQYYKELEKNS